VPLQSIKNPICIATCYQVLIPSYDVYVVFRVFGKGARTLSVKFSPCDLAVVRREADITVSGVFVSSTYDRIHGHPLLTFARL
jgi:hypothetical protein